MWVYRSERYSPDELMHYGILGMRWGIRRTPEELGHEILKNEHKQAENAAKIAKIEKKHQDHPNQPYRKSEARLYKRAKKLADEHENLLIDKDVAEKHQKALEAKAALKEQQRAAKEAKRAQKEAIRAQKEAQKEMERREKANSHNLQNKPLAEMTDKELADYLTRKANEARYMQLNPKPHSFMDDVSDFAKKNSGKAVQALVDVGLDLGKEAIKREVKKEWDAKEIQPNSRKKYENKEVSSLNDKDLSNWLKRVENENKLKDALSGKKTKGMSSEEVEDMIYRILNERGI